MKAADLYREVPIIVGLLLLLIAATQVVCFTLIHSVSGGIPKKLDYSL